MKTDKKRALSQDKIVGGTTGHEYNLLRFDSELLAFQAFVAGLKTGKQQNDLH